MADPGRPIFLERESYRRRRIGDAARLLPVLGLILLLVPVLWASDNKTAVALIYVFSVWALLIGVIGFLSRHLSNSVQWGEDAPSDGTADER